MARKLLVTVGISLLRDNISEKMAQKVGFQDLSGAGPLRDLSGLYQCLKGEDKRQRGDESYVFQLDTPQLSHVRSAFVKAITTLWEQAEPYKERDKCKFSGAELASLKALHQDGASVHALRADDEIILLASDTPSGRFCAKVLEQVLREGKIGLPTCKVHSIEVSGLQPDSVDKFVERGLPYAAQLLITHGENAILIGSGGYKGLLPYLGPVAMRLKIPIFYLYEDSEELLELRPLPVKFDLSVIQRYPRTFDHLRPREAMRKKEDERALRPAKLFWADLESEAGSDFAEVKAEIQEYGLVQTRSINGEDYVRLSATGILAYFLAHLDSHLTAVHHQEPLMGD